MVSTQQPKHRVVVRGGLSYEDFIAKTKDMGDVEKTPALIVDLDETLCLIGDRDPHDATELAYDELNHVIYRLIVKYRKDGYALIIITGRSIKYAEATQQWLAKYNVPYDLLIMRPEGDKQPDFTLKHRAYNEYIKDHYDVEFVLEDRTRVVKRWREIGLICFQVKDGDY